MPSTNPNRPILPSSRGATCPHCGGYVMRCYRGDTVETAMARHIRLAHEPEPKK